MQVPQGVRVSVKISEYCPLNVVFLERPGSPCKRLETTFAPHCFHVDTTSTNNVRRSNISLDAMIGLAPAPTRPSSSSCG